MKTLYRLMLALAVSAMMPTNSSAQKVRYDFSAAADFARLKTYSIKDTAPSETITEQTTMYDSPLIRQRTREAIQSHLDGLGMKRDDEHPDVYVTARRSFKTEYMTYHPAYGYAHPYSWYGWGYPHGWGGYGPVYTREVVIGTLTVDFEDASSGELMWRGTSERRVSNTSKPEKRMKRVNREVAKIFRNFPPSPGELDDDDDDEDAEDEDDEQ